MLAGASETPEELRRRVTSPGGTTEAAINSMSQHQLDRIIIDAIRAAQQRGRELGAAMK
jgi:pyrroline-5-carboxylate reductase